MVTPDFSLSQNRNGILAVGATMVIGALTGKAVSTWMLVVIFLAVRFVPTLLGVVRVICSTH